MKRSAIVLAMMLFLLVGISSRPVVYAAPASKGKKQKISNKKYQSFLKSLSSDEWALRVFAVLEAKKYSDAKVLKHVLEQFEVEEDPTVQAFILNTLGTWKQSDLQPFTSEAVLEKTARLIPAAKDEYTSNGIHTFFTAVLSGRASEKNLKRWKKTWKKTRKYWPKIKEKAVKKWVKKNGPLAEDTVDLTPSKKIKHICKASVIDYLDDFRDNGLQICLLIEDTSPMADVNDRFRKEIPALTRALKMLTPKMRIGLIAYNQDGPTFLAPVTDDVKVFDTVFQKIGNDSEGKFVTLHPVITKALAELDWKAQGSKNMFVIAATPVIGAHQSATAAKIKLANNKGFTCNFFGLNQGSTVNLRNVDQFENYAKIGGGHEVSITRKTSIALEIIQSVFGVSNLEHVSEFSKGLLLLNTLYKAKK